MKFSEAIQLLEQDAHKPTQGVYKSNHKAAFAKYDHYYPGEDLHVTEVFNHYDDLYAMMAQDGLSPFTLRNYTHCYKLLLTSAPVSKLLGADVVKTHLQCLDAKIKEADKLVNQKRQLQKDKNREEAVVHENEQEQEHERLSETSEEASVNDEEGDDSDDDSVGINFDILTTTAPTSNAVPSLEVRVLEAELNSARKHLQDMKMELIKYKTLSERYEDEVKFLRSYFMG